MRRIPGLGQDRAQNEDSHVDCDGFLATGGVVPFNFVQSAYMPPPVNYLDPPTTESENE